MDDALGMSSIQSISNLNAQVQNLFDLQRLAVDPVQVCLPRRACVAGNRGRISNEYSCVTREGCRR
jgi:hypothetical protein